MLGRVQGFWRRAQGLLLGGHGGNVERLLDFSALGSTC